LAGLICVPLGSARRSYAAWKMCSSRRVIDNRLTALDIAIPFSRMSSKTINTQRVLVLHIARLRSVNAAVLRTRRWKSNLSGTYFVTATLSISEMEVGSGNVHSSSLMRMLLTAYEKNECRSKCEMR
jgi:hypothetical protein